MNLHSYSPLQIHWCSFWSSYWFSPPQWKFVKEWALELIRNQWQAPTDAQMGMLVVSHVWRAGFTVLYFWLPAVRILSILFSQRLSKFFMGNSSRWQISIWNAYITKYLFKVLYRLHENLGKSLQMLKMLHKFNELRLYISIIVDCYEQEQIQAFIAHCAWALWLNDPHPRQNSISTCRCHCKCRGEKGFRRWNNQTIYC